MGIATAIIAFLGTVVGIIIKRHQDRERELLSWAMQAALKDYEIESEDDSLPKKPISSHLYFHYHWLKIIDSGKASPQELKTLTRISFALVSVSSEVHKEISANEN